MLVPVAVSEALKQTDTRRQNCALCLDSITARAGYASIMLVLTGMLVNALNREIEN